MNAKMVVLVAALIAAPRAQAPTATAADPPRSSVNASEPPTNDPVKGNPPAPAVRTTTRTTNRQATGCAMA